MTNQLTTTNNVILEQIAQRTSELSATNNVILEQIAQMTSKLSATNDTIDTLLDLKRLISPQSETNPASRDLKNLSRLIHNRDNRNRLAYTRVKTSPPLEVSVEQLYLESLVIGGRLSDVTPDVQTFILYALLVKGVEKICVVDDLGYPDVWMVFAELNAEKENEVIGHCMKFCDETKLEPVHYMMLTADEFNQYEGSPLVTLQVGGASLK